MAGAFKHIHNKHLHSDNRDGHKPVYESNTIKKIFFESVSISESLDNKFAQFFKIFDLFVHKILE
jgi:hypothetical protein